MRKIIEISVVGLLLTCLAMAGIQLNPVDRLTEQYFSIQKSLASDSIKGVSGSAIEITKISRQLAGTQKKYKTQLIALENAANKLSAADLKSARAGFGELSDALITYLKAAGSKTNLPFQFYCPMVKKNWLQPDKAIRNPYYGSIMPTCGEMVEFGKVVK
jgi:hypothetical protein